MKKKICILAVLTMIASFIVGGGIVYAENLSDLQKDESLSEFLSIDVLERSVSDSILFDLEMDPVYDCRDDEKTRDMIIEFMIAGFPYESGTTILHETEIDDPRGLYGGEAGRCPAEEVDRVARDYFNCSEEALEMAKNSGSSEHFYYEDGYYYYNAIGGYGMDSYEPQIRYPVKTGDRYHLFYDVYIEYMGEDEPPELIGPEYAEVGKKEIGGKEQWTLYTLSYDPKILATGSPYMPPIERVKYMAFWLADQTADGNATKIYMPTEIAGIVSTLGVIGESIGIGDRTEISQKPKPDKSSEMDPCLKPTTSKEGVQSAKTLNQITSDLEERRKDVL